MFAYILRRLFYAIPILLGVNVLTFSLFFMVNTPDDMARMQLGVKHVTPEAMERWKIERGYDRPLFWNASASGLEKAKNTLFFTKSARMFWGDFGRAEDGRDIRREILSRAGPSLMLALPTFLLGLFVAVSFALLLAFFRATALDFSGVALCVALMSISSLFYIIGGQYLFAKLWRIAPISGLGDGIDAWRFVFLPIVIGVASAIGANARWYRTLFLEETEKEYVRAARARGLSEPRIFFRHILKNAMIPILTGVVAVIPSLFLGSLLMESFFGIPGLGSYTIDAIHAQDFPVVRAMVFIGSALYVAGLLLTDISYTLADPRIRFS
ncbi:MAG: ABC transporter permease [Zoogloeaceae bacterium]|jgi:peptide/nickel transport system permease protein|nr:ABC transporter permease [Zoogloeaceae bacterium]